MTTPADIQQHVYELIGTVKALSAGVDRLAAQVESGFDDARSEMRNVKHDQRNIEQVITGMRDRLSEVQTQAKQAVEKTESVERQVKDLKQPVEQAAAKPPPPTKGLIASATVFGAGAMYFLAPVLRDWMADLAKHFHFVP